MSSQLVNLPEMPSQLVLDQIVEAEMEEDKKSNSVLKTLSIMSVQQEKQRSAKKQGAMKRNSKEKVNKFAKENNERLVALMARKDLKRQELLARLRQLRFETTETGTRIEEFFRAADDMEGLIEKDVAKVSVESDDLIGHLRATRQHRKEGLVQDEEAVVKAAIKDKLVQLDTAMCEWTMKQEKADKGHPGLLLLSRTRG